MTADPLTKLCLASVGAAFIHAAADDAPFRHWTLTTVLPEGVLSLLMALETRLTANDLPQVLQPPCWAKRRYFSDGRLAADPACAAVADAFRSPTVTTLIELVTKIDLSGSRLRIDLRTCAAQALLAASNELEASRFTLLVCLRGSGRDMRFAAGPPRDGEGLSFWPNLGIAFAARDRDGHRIELRAGPGAEHFLVVDYVEPAGRAPDPRALPDFTVGRRTYG